MPVIVPLILKSSAMARTPCKSARLITERIALWSERSQRIVSYHNAICVTAELRTRGSVLQVIFTVNAIQVNYADQDVDSSFPGKSLGVYHQYKMYYSEDGKKWKILIDKSGNKKDVPHDYVELATPVQARFIKLKIYTCLPVSLPSAG